MTLQLLLSAMDLKDLSFCKDMNVQSNVILVNQSDVYRFNEEVYGKYKIEIYTWSERGVGLSRNTALMRADADIILFSDDDCIYVDGYPEIVQKAFQDHPEADVIFFNMPSLNKSRIESIEKNFHRVRWYNCFRYGAFRLAARLDSLRKKNLCFSLLFGGGARYSAGEDSIFIVDCLRRGLRLYASPCCIGTVRQESSTWFRGYTEKYYRDRGALFCAISQRFAYFLCIQFILRYRRNTRNIGGMWKAWKLMYQGVNEYINYGRCL